ncbi:MAG: T9SS C-terminal target domain-containing protein [Bacteroidetes bacterium]|nr:T9SS C-terminal target domain-containing protein [Bacteroidota bacterium]
MILGRKQRSVILLAVITAGFTTLTARENIGMGSGKNNTASTVNSVAALCEPARAQITFDLNNVRATILNAGDMWWDIFGTQNARYEIPKNSGSHSLFAASIWVGGLDAGSNLRVAAMTYRQTGNDFWPGPLDPVTVSTDDQMCRKYDKHFVITRKEVEDFVGAKADPAAYPGYQIPSSILNWPANGENGNQLAPFFDADGDNYYNPEGSGDYPYYNIANSNSCDTNFLFGDKTIWWVFNDKGNVHTESSSPPIGLEIQAQAFAYSTNDEINNMTFYKYKIINRSFSSLNQTYFGKWVDADLGCATDDYVGCDVARGLGYTYNGDGDDESCLGVTGYGDALPAVGVDFFEGPVADIGDGIDNDRDGCVDCTNVNNGTTTIQVPETQLREKIIMSKFVYYNNDNSLQGNPDKASDFYNYCRGMWRDGLPMTYGGSGRGGSLACNFMFPGDTDPLGIGTGNVPQVPWYETIKPADRRFFQSAGPFTLQPGARNYITVGAVWARALPGAGNKAAITLLQAADDKAQRLFDNCFKVLDGPDAPDVTLQELDKEVILYLSHSPLSNNYLQKYTEVDPAIPAISGYDRTYDFEGYQIFQLKNASVSQTELSDPDKARLVAQVDVTNGVKQLINYYYDEALQGYTPREEVNGADKGIAKSFRVTEDQFASGDKRLINHKQYYFMAISYAHNNYKNYSQTDPALYDGQTQPYKAGRKNIKVYTAIPHIPTPEANGTKMNAGYGTGVKIKRIEGQGNGGNILDLTDETVARILTSPEHRVIDPEYQAGKGPINVRVIDPLNVVKGDFTFYMLPGITNSTNAAVQQGAIDTAKWKIKNNTTGEIISSQQSIQLQTEQIIPQWGISISISKSGNPGPSDNIKDNGFLEASISYTDPTKAWFSGIADQDGEFSENWIRSGVTEAPNTNPTTEETVYQDRFIGATTSPADAEQVYENILGGLIAPYALTGASYKTGGFVYAEGGPKYGVFNSINTLNDMPFLASVDIVITSDKSKWSRCVVLEMQEETQLAVGGVAKHAIRASASVDKEGRKSGDPGTVSDGSENDPNFISSTGMGWFPGYAINIETGERLNLAFGEDSWLVAENGADMIWNPTSNSYSNLGTLLWGGKHHLFVFNSSGLYSGSSAFAKDMPRYDHGQYIRNQIPAASNATAMNGTIWNHCIWTGIPLVNSSFSSMSQVNKNLAIPSDLKIRLRVAKRYTRAYSGYFNNTTFQLTYQTDVAATPQNRNYPMYTFNTYDLETVTSDEMSAKDALELINVVPNPYYAYSAYETNRLDNRVKITNVPEKCTISIYTINGSLVRRFKKDDPKTSQDWDLKNQSNIPVASGMYIIHVDVPGVGEKIVKWFGVMRPIDLESF